MSPTLPSTIRRSYIGLYAILFSGAVLGTVLFVATLYLASQSLVTPQAAQLLLAFVGIVALSTLVWAYFYWASFVTLSDAGIEFTVYRSLFWPVQAECAWAEIRDVQASEEGVVQSLFNVGRLTVETAGTKPNLSLSWVPRVTYWKKYIESRKLSTPE